MPDPIVMLLSNAFRPDPRVAREAHSLKDHGYPVTVIGWDRRAELRPRETRQGVEVIRVQTVRSAYGSGWRQLFYLPRFWRQAAHLAIHLRPAAIHCHDLDTLYAGCQIKKRLRCPLVYDAHEDYPAMMSLYLPGPLVKALAWLEQRLLGQVDHTITASSVFADKLRAHGIAPVVTIGNYSSLEPFDAVNPAEVAAARERLGLAADDLVVAYIGGFSRNRQLLPLIEAARELPDVQMLLWGDGHQRAAVEAAAKQTPNVHYLGWLAAPEVPLYTCLADIIYYCLRPDYPGAIYNAPNTLSNAMAAGRPIIANDVGDLGRIVRQTGCGLLLSEVTPQAIRQAIRTLHDPALRRQMGQAGRIAAETEYNWAIAEQKLAHVYGTLVGRPGPLV